MSQPSDRDLIAAASQGQVAAFASLIGRHRDVRTRYAMRMLGDYDAADEALQTAFVRAFQSIARYRAPEDFESWLFRIIINECRSRALRQAVRARRVTGEMDAIADWRAAVEGSENGADVQRALNQIDPINREAFILQYVEELSYPQISALTGASVVTLERQVDRACSRLRELLPERQSEMTGSVPGLDASVDNVGPSFPVRAAMPLRRPEVLNESFEDRLMTKLLRAADGNEESGGLGAPAAKIGSLVNALPNDHPTPRTPALPPPPSPATMAEPALFGGGFSLPRVPHLREIAIAMGISAVAFGGGYLVGGRKGSRGVAVASAKSKVTAPKIVRRIDTVRVVRGDTVFLVRFGFADPSAKSVSLVGDFNRWDPAATPLSRVAPGSWTRTLRLTPNRHEYAFVVDGKRWVTDRLARSTHDAFDVESSVLADNAASAEVEKNSASARLKKVLPRASAERVLASIASARAKELPATILENRALKFAAKGVSAKDIEDAIAADAEAMARASQLLTAAGRRDPTAGEIDATAQLFGEGADSASVAALARFAAAGRPIDVPLRVGAELVATSSSPRQTLAHVEDRVRGGATDAELEEMLDAANAVAATSKTAEKQARVAGKSSSTSVQQAGTPSKTKAANRSKRKAVDK